MATPSAAVSGSRLTVTLSMFPFSNRLRSLPGAVFAGDRRVWAAASALGVPLMVVVLVWCLIPRPYYTGTDSVNAVTLSSPIDRHVRACVSGLQIPAGTRRLQLPLTSGQSRSPRIIATVRAAGTVTRTRIERPLRVGIARRVELALPAIRHTVPASLCLRSERGAFAIASSESTEGYGQITIGRTATNYRAAVWYLPKAGPRVSYLGDSGA